jgi:acyl-CoA synthetase (AMP-forming)/AMP-acid ligase II
MWGVLPDILDRACTYYAEQVAIVDNDRSLTYRQLLQWRNQIAHALVASGVQKGERVGLLMPNCLEFIPVQHGIWAAGAVLVQMPTRAAADGFRSNLAQTAATTLIYHAKFESAVAAIRPELPKLQNVIRVGAAQQAEVDALDFDELVSAQPATRPEVMINEDDRSGGIENKAFAIVVDPAQS